MLDLGGDLIEPISPLNEESGVHKFILENGEGLHHVAYDVTGIENVMAKLKEQNIELIDEVPKPGFMGHTIAFIKPDSTMGTLWELVEDSH